MTTVAPRAKPIDREAFLQRHAKLFARDAILDEHEFFGFEAARKSSVIQWGREKAKGVRKSTPDTLTKVIQIPGIWVEFKWPPNKPRDDQEAMGKRLRLLGDIWDWADTIEGYRRILLQSGVRLRTNSEFLAQYHQAGAETLVAKAEAKRGDAPKSYSPNKAKAKPRYTATGKRAGRMALILP